LTRARSTTGYSPGARCSHRSRPPRRRSDRRGDRYRHRWSRRSRRRSRARTSGLAGVVPGRRDARCRRSRVNGDGVEAQAGVGHIAERLLRFELDGSREPGRCGFQPVRVDEGAEGWQRGRRDGDDADLEQRDAAVLRRTGRLPDVLRCHAKHCRKARCGARSSPGRAREDCAGGPLGGSAAAGRDGCLQVVR